MKWILSADETTLINLENVVYIDLFKFDVRVYLTDNEDDYYVVYEGTEPGDFDDFFLNLLKKLEVIK